MKKRYIEAILVIALSWILIPNMTVGTPSSNDVLHKAMLSSQIDYWFVGHLGETNEDGMLLVWDATIQGDINGDMKWYFGPSPNPGGDIAGGNIGYYTARWEIWVDDELLLAGESAGKTVTLGDADGVWDGQGIVTEACKHLNTLKGSRIYESGSVDWTFPYSGTGIFTITGP